MLLSCSVPENRVDLLATGVVRWAYTESSNSNDAPVAPLTVDILYVSYAQVVLVDGDARNLLV